ncbi:hypothetical protein P3G55_17400 [Leptospira sp. 96542]|nr:hypothetical protein [Leptospira sp. 96542]
MSALPNDALVSGASVPAAQDANKVTARLEIRTQTVQCFVITGASRGPGLGVLDPITVILTDTWGQGRLIVESFGSAWSAYFGSVGPQTLRQFLASCDEDYLGDKLTCRMQEEAYVRDVARAVIDGLREWEVNTSTFADLHLNLIAAAGATA